MPFIARRERAPRFFLSASRTLLITSKTEVSKYTEERKKENFHKSSSSFTSRRHAEIRETEDWTFFFLSRSKRDVAARLSFCLRSRSKFCVISTQWLVAAIRLSNLRPMRLVVLVVLLIESLHGVRRRQIEMLGDECQSHDECRRTPVDGSRVCFLSQCQCSPGFVPIDSFRCIRDLDLGRRKTKNSTHRVSTRSVRIRRLSKPLVELECTRGACACLPGYVPLGKYLCYNLDGNDQRKSPFCSSASDLFIFFRRRRRRRRRRTSGVDRKTKFRWQMFVQRSMFGWPFGMFRRDLFVPTRIFPTRRLDVRRRVRCEPNETCEVLASRCSF